MIIIVLFIGLFDWPNYSLQTKDLTDDDFQLPVYKCGAATQLTKGWIIKKHGNYRVPDENAPIIMKNQFVIRSSTQKMNIGHNEGIKQLVPFADGGDCGSVIFMMKDKILYPVAMITGRVVSGEYPRDIYATPIQAVLKVLKDICCPNTEFMGFQAIEKKSRCVCKTL